jgi:hypothetical protein
VAGFGVIRNSFEPLGCIIGDLFNNYQVSSEGPES